MGFSVLRFRGFAWVLLTVLTAALLGWSAAPTPAQAALGGLFTPITPIRALETRPSSALSPNGTRRLVLAGQFGIPLDATAVALNVTAVEPTQDTFLTVWPAATPRPDTSNLNLKAGRVRANAVIVRLNEGAIDIYNFAGNTFVLVDVNGWFSGGATADGGFAGVNPLRLLDTRQGIGRPGSIPVGPGSTTVLQVGGFGGVPTSGVSAVALNVTGTESSLSTFVTTFPAGSALPDVSSLNLAPAQTAANFVIVPLSASGQVSLYNAFGSVHLLVDVMGYFQSGTPTTGGFVAVVPTRVVDTRSSTPLQGRGWRAVKAGGFGGIPTSGVGAIAANLTISQPTSDSFLTAFPTAPGFSDASQAFVPTASLPNASNVNFRVGETTPNAANLAVGPEASIWTYNYAGRADLIVDVSGYWIGTTPVGNTPPAPAAGPGPGQVVRSIVSSNGNPLYWDTCGPIYWYVEPTNGTGKGFDEVESAMARVTYRTGLPLIYGGQIPSAELSNLGSRQIYIRWRSSAQDSILGGSTVAVARTYFYPTGEIDASLVTLRTDLSGINGGFGPGVTWGSVLIHELGHSMGLGHTSNDISQMMYPSITRNLDEYGGGDLTGLRDIVRPGCALNSSENGPRQALVDVD